MERKIGTVKALWRYPVKSMAGESLGSIALGLRGIEGDRRFAFMITGSKSDFPFLNASKYPTLIGYKPYLSDSLCRVVTPAGEDLELHGDALQKELAAVYGSPVHAVHFKNGIFDEAEISVISTATIRQIADTSGNKLDIRRFRPNIVIDLINDQPFGEDQWIGRTLVIGPCTIGVTMRDLRCKMINIDPDTIASEPGILKTVGRLNEACAGVYGCVLKVGTIAVGNEIHVIDP